MRALVPGWRHCFRNNRRRYDAEKTLAAFGHFVRDETDLEALMAELLRVTEEAMQPETVAVWLRDPRS